MVYEVGPNVVVIMLALISAIGSLLAAVHASEARRNSEATRDFVVKDSLKRRQ